MELRLSHIVRTNEYNEVKRLYSEEELNILRDIQ